MACSFFLLRFEFELPEIPCKLCLSLPIERWAIIGVFASLCNLRGKNHTRWLTALTTVSLGEELQDFEHLWLGNAFETRLNFSPSLPDIVDFLPEPFDDFLPFCLVIEGIYADFPRVNRDEFPMQLEGNARRGIDVLKTPERGVQIWNHFTYVLIEMGYQVDRLGLGSALGADKFLGVTIE
jgi:hypothetical protein